MVRPMFTPPVFSRVTTCIKAHDRAPAWFAFLFVSSRRNAAPWLIGAGGVDPILMSMQTFEHLPSNQAPYLPVISGGVPF